jgi:hypothetical protein
MQCETIKPGKECSFWGKLGCKNEDGRCHTVAEKCGECSRQEDVEAGKFCTVYAKPEDQWALGVCNMATHIKLESEETQKMLNPLKAAKRAAAGR